MIPRGRLAGPRTAGTRTPVGGPGYGEPLAFIRKP